jgi:hypothetical protein
MRTIFSVLLIFFSLASQADLKNHHLYPNITGFDNPIIQYTQYGQSTLGIEKATTSDGSKYKPSVAVSEIMVGVMRERYDNYFSYIGVFSASSQSGQASKIPGEPEAELSNYLGLTYGTGSHAGMLDWSLSFEGGTGQVVVDGSKKNAIGVGLGFDVAVALHPMVDVGASINVNRHYSGAGIFIKLNL